LRLNSVGDLTPLSKLEKLEILDISGTMVEELSPLKDSQSLKCLVFCWLYRNPPKGIGNLDALAV
jgi:Leucine-rich repeat (LRR) protein